MTTIPMTPAQIKLLLPLLSDAVRRLERPADEAKPLADVLGVTGEDTAAAADDLHAVSQKIATATHNAFF